MNRLTNQNLKNIEMLFEQKTGVELHPQHWSGKRKWILAAALACCLVLTSCGFVLFSSLNQDALSLQGTYENGIVSVLVVNGSEKPLRFQEQVKLMSWKNGEIPSSGGKVRFENTIFDPHSSGTMTIDLSGAYPMEVLESKSALNDLYLILTNNDFAFGQNWMCHFVMNPAVTEAVTEVSSAELEAQTINGIAPSLQFYFKDHYLDQAPASNSANREYMKAVQALLSQQKGMQVHSMDPLLALETPENTLWTTLNHHSLDSFNRMVGSIFPGDGLDSALMLGVSLPQYQGQEDGGIGDFKLLYYFTFPTQQLQQEGAYAFVYGRIITFPEMEGYQVYTDQEYTVYDLTDFFYTDLDAYLDEFVSAYGADVYVDETVRQQVHTVYDYYRDRENLKFRYLLP